MINDTYLWLYNTFFGPGEISPIFADIAPQLCAIGAIAIVCFVVWTVLSLFRFFMHYIGSLASGGKK